jgi:undecaprenyl-diphosphatase
MASSPPTDPAPPRRLTSALPDGRRAVLLVAVLAGLILAGWGAGELIGSLHTADLTAVRDVAGDRTPAATAIAHVLSRLGSSLIIVPVALVCCAVLYRLAGPASALFLAVSTAGATVIFNLDKLLVGRPRPPVRHLEVVAHSSFPSGHATLSAAFYLALVIAFASLSRSRARAAAGLAVAVVLVAGISASRVYLGVHYPSDVAAGVLLATAWTAAVARCVLPRPGAISRGGAIAPPDPPRQVVAPRGPDRAQAARESSP